MTTFDENKLPDRKGYALIKAWYDQRYGKHHDGARLVIFGPTGTGKTRILGELEDQGYDERSDTYFSCVVQTAALLENVERLCKEKMDLFTIAATDYCRKCPENDENDGTCERGRRNRANYPAPCDGIAIDDAQDFQTKTLLGYLKAVLDTARPVVVAIQTPEGLHLADVKAWLVRELGQTRNTLPAEAVVRRLLEPSNTIIVLSK